MKRLKRSNSPFPIQGDATHTDAGKCYSKIVERLLVTNGSRQQLLVTSAGESEGKTVTAVNLAYAFHARCIPVLLAEFSFHRPTFAEVFGPSPLRYGIEDVLIHGVSLASTIFVRNDDDLSISMVNSRQETDGLLAPSVRLDNLLAEARNNYDWTVFDAASVESLPEIKSVAARANLVLLVVRARQTRPDAIRDALARIDHPHTLVLLNDK